ncbi:hypothetical protein PCL_01169 [Purpureocillium lilacinum]|uniref:Rho2 GTPase n=1 Tax=Purpureocillium lilacinum TaxID=33203 RepID=A0A2U3E4U5_PURLI|nr:hypothetical protein PCL_01169 [Purpureocillium lilacinum]
MCSGLEATEVTAACRAVPRLRVPRRPAARKPALRIAVRRRVRQSPAITLPCTSRASLACQKTLSDIHGDPLHPVTQPSGYRCTKRRGSIDASGGVHTRDWTAHGIVRPMLAQVSYSRDGAMRRETGAFAGQPSALTSTVHVGRSQPPCNGLSSRGATPSCARAVEAEQASQPMPKGLGACCWSMGWTGRPFGDGITARVASATNTLHPGSRYWEAQTAEAARASEQLGTATLPCAAPRCQEARSGCVVGGQGRPTADGRGSPSSLGPIANGDARHAQSCPTRRRVRGPRHPSSRVDVLLGRCIASSVVVFLRDRNGGHRAARPGQHPERKKREAPLETTGASRSGRVSRTFRHRNAPAGTPGAQTPGRRARAPVVANEAAADSAQTARVGSAQPSAARQDEPPLGVAVQLGKRERPASGCVQVQGPGRSSPHFARYRAHCRTWNPPVFPLLLDQSISPCPSIRRPPGRRAPLPPLPPTQKPQLVLTLLKLSHSHSDSSASRPSPSPTIRVARPLPSAVIAPGPPSGPLADRSQNASADLRPSHRTGRPADQVYGLRRPRLASLPRRASEHRIKGAEVETRSCLSSCSTSPTAAEDTPRPRRSLALHPEGWRSSRTAVLDSPRPQLRALREELALLHHGERKSAERHPQIPTVFENYVTDCRVDGKSVQLALWDTAGQEDYERLRPLAYSKAHVILIGFSIDTPDSLDNVKHKWIEEATRLCAGVPIILVGLKKDLREDPVAIEEMRKKSLRFVTQHDGEVAAREVGARRYLECSSLSGEGVDDVFEAATRAALLTFEKGEGSGCCVVL